MTELTIQELIEELLSRSDWRVYDALKELGLVE